MKPKCVPFKKGIEQFFHGGTLVLRNRENLKMGIQCLFLSALEGSYLLFKLYRCIHN